VTRDPEAIRDAARVLLPGVGAFGDAMASLRDGGLDEVLAREVREAGKPFMAICLGMQLLATTSEEHAESGQPHTGLGWLPAHVARIRPNDARLKIPHMGWNGLELRRRHPIVDRLNPRNLNFYFVHSYWMQCREERDVVATVDYGGPLTAIVARDNIIASQFHPEKSQDSGLELLGRFLAWNP
jgi:glutamine amidotransferase